jgi:hypothetical protein
LTVPRGLTRLGGVARNLRTKAAYSQIRPTSETRNQLPSWPRADRDRLQYALDTSVLAKIEPKPTTADKNADGRPAISIGRSIRQATHSNPSEERVSIGPIHRPTFPLR